MYNVIIVEDEVRVSKLIIKLIDWDGLGLSLAGVSYDGITAYEMIEKVRPEIVITDIRLPGMSGVDLIEHISKEEDPKPKFIIISGYKEFEYAQRAVKYDVEDYLIKPINKAELNAALSKTVDKLSKAETLHQKRHSMDEQLNYYRNLHRTLMIKDIVETSEGLKSLSSDVFNRRYGVEFKKPYVCSFIIKLFFADGSANNISFFQEKVSEVISEHFFENSAVAKFQQGIICHVNFDKKQRAGFLVKIDELKIQLDKILFPYDFVSYVIAVGEESLIDKNGYIKTTRSAEYTANATIALGDTVLFYKDIPPKVSLDHIIKNAELESVLVNAIERLEEGLFQSYFSLFKRMAKESPNYAVALYEVVERIVDQIMSAFQKQYNSIYSVQKDWEAVRNKILNSRTTEILLESVEQSVLETVRGINKCIQQLENPTITAVKHYVETHYAEKLTLEVVAGEVFLNSAYLAALFKKETGLTFLEYLTSVRIHHAKLLLQDLKLSISQITHAVGYNDSKYFTRIFTKSTGVKPLEYRKLYVNNLL